MNYPSPSKKIMVLSIMVKLKILQLIEKIVHLNY